MDERNDPTDAQFRSDPSRVLTLTDGVIAIAMTLLALDLKPTVERAVNTGKLLNSSHDLTAYFSQYGGTYFAFILAFVLIAQYWIVHHRLVANMDHHGLGFAWANMVFLLGITLLPVVTYILGVYEGKLPTILYAADLILISLAIWLLGAVIGHGNLLRVPHTPAQIRHGQIRAAVTVVIPVIVIVVTLTTNFNSNWLFFLYALQEVPGQAIERRRRRKESAS